MISASTLTDNHHDGARPTAGIRQGAAWHGFRLASANDAPFAVVATSRPAELTRDQTAQAVPDEIDGSLAWVGRLACWSTALLTASLIVLAVN